MVFLLSSFWLYSCPIKYAAKILANYKSAYMFDFVYQNNILDSDYFVLMLVDKFLLILFVSFIFMCILEEFFLKMEKSWVNIKCFKNDIIFIIFFLFLLLIPIARVDRTKNSVIETRTFATYKPFIDFSNRKINYEYGKNLNEWFNDRFFGRIYLIYLNRFIVSHLSVSCAKYSPRVFDKKKKFFI